MLITPIILIIILILKTTADEPTRLRRPTQSVTQGAESMEIIKTYKDGSQIPNPLRKKKKKKMSRGKKR